MIILRILPLLLMIQFAHAAPGDKPVDMSQSLSRMVVVEGPGEKYFAFDPKDFHDTVFFGDAKSMYELRVRSSSFDKKKMTRASAYYWEPRAGGYSTFRLSKGKWQVECGKRKTALQRVPDKQAQALVKQMKFYKSKWRRQAHWLGRDDQGRYYFVDKRRNLYGGGDHRVFVGFRGSMKQQAMKNVVSDTKGEIFSTKKGQLRLVTGAPADMWVHKKKKLQLVEVPVLDNIKLIYADLGVYDGKLTGTPCDFY